MKKVIVAMTVMFFAVVPLGGMWSISFRPIIEGSTDQSFIYFIYDDLIPLAGLVVGATVVLYEEIEELRKEVKASSERQINQNRSDYERLLDYTIAMQHGVKWTEETAVYGLLPEERHGK